MMCALCAEPVTQAQLHVEIPCHIVIDGELVTTAALHLSGPPGRATCYDRWIGGYRPHHLEHLR